MIGIIGERRGTEYLDQVLNQDRGSENVRLAVYGSLPNLATPEDLDRLIDLLKDAQNEDERKAIQDAVVHVSVSGGRTEAVIQALQAAPDSQKPGLLEILSGIGGEQALNAVAASAENGNSAVKSAAIRALADWPDASAIQPLLGTFENAPPPDRERMIEGYIRLVHESKYSAKDKVGFIHKAMELTSSTGERVRLLKAFSSMQSTGALQATAVYFNSENRDVSDQAIYTAAEILAPHYDPISSSFNTTSTAFAVLESTTGPEFKNRIEQKVQEIIARKEAEEGFDILFNSRDLSGWSGDTEDYIVQDNQIIHKSGGSGRIFTEAQYSDFILRFEFKLTPGANNGLAIRSPQQGDPAYSGMEIQILDNTAEKYADLEPYQYHGSIYGVAASERGHLKPTGEWNSQEVIADGSSITVKLNGVTILDTDIREASTPKTPDGRDHPGLQRDRGHIGFLGHGDEVAFRNIQIRNLDDYSPIYSFGEERGNGMNQPPEGYTALFNGKDLSGWKGLVENPEVRAEMTPGELSRAQVKADSVMRKHWSVRNGILYFDGEGESLATVKDYKNFEMLVDWKIEPHGDSGIYLRGSPQVQIWDITENPVGSGGLYNNQKHQSDPLVPADNPIGEWNTMRIKMIGEQVTVHLNGELVVPNVVMENYWNRDIPIYPKGQIELQAHNTPLYFRNIFIKEIPGTKPLFNGADLAGWEHVGKDSQSDPEWHANEGILYTEGGSGWLSTKKQYENFKLELEYRLQDGGNSGIFLRAPHDGNPAYEGIEIQLLDDHSDQYLDLEPWQYTGSIYDVKAPSVRPAKKAGEWQQMTIVAKGPELKVTLNGKIVVNTSLVNFMNRVDEHPGLKRRKGYIGLQNNNSRVEFRNIKITEIN